MEDIEKSIRKKLRDEKARDALCIGERPLISISEPMDNFLVASFSDFGYNEDASNEQFYVNETYTDNVDKVMQYKDRYRCNSEEDRMKYNAEIKKKLYSMASGESFKIGRISMSIPRDNVGESKREYNNWIREIAGLKWSQINHSVCILMLINEKKELINNAVLMTLITGFECDNAMEIQGNLQTVIYGINEINNFVNGNKLSILKSDLRDAVECLGRNPGDYCLKREIGRNKEVYWFCRYGA